jgi:hypothetical protein
MATHLMISKEGNTLALKIEDTHMEQQYPQMGEQSIFFSCIS